MIEALAFSLVSAFAAVNGLDVPPQSTAPAAEAAVQEPGPVAMAASPAVPTTVPAPPVVSAPGPAALSTTDPSVHEAFPGVALAPEPAPLLPDVEFDGDEQRADTGDWPSPIYRCGETVTDAAQLASITGLPVEQVAGRLDQNCERL